jgi:sugar phosphate isomerase/epimerase
MQNVLSRRAFAAAAAAVAAAPAAALAMDPVRRRGPSRMKLSLAAYSFRHYLTDHRRGTSPATAAPMTLESFVDLCAEYPLDGVELTSYYVPDPPPEGYLHALRRRAFLLGLTVSGTAIGNTFTHPPGEKRAEQMAYTRRWIDRAAEMGAPTIRIFAGEVQKGTTEAQARQWCVEAIREACTHAARRGVILALENHGGIVTTADQLLSIVREIESDWFGVNWDSGNFRSADPYAELKAIAPYAVTAQVKVSIGAAGKSQPADWARVIRLLEEVGYRGWVALEYEEQEDAKIAVPRLLDQLHGLIRAPAP